MKLSEKKELIGTLAQNYVIEKEDNKVWGRENSSSYTFAKGKLIGACMAFNLEIVETKEVLIVKNRKNILAKLDLKSFVE